MDIAALHTVEHLFATCLRNSSAASDVVYFGPMGCRTGCYLLLFGEKTPQDALPLVLEACDFTLNFEGAIPGAEAAECGNYLEHNLSRSPNTTPPATSRSSSPTAASLTRKSRGEALLSIFKAARKTVFLLYAKGSENGKGLFSESAPCDPKTPHTPTRYI